MGLLETLTAACSMYGASQTTQNMAIDDTMTPAVTSLSTSTATLSSMVGCGDQNYQNVQDTKAYVEQLSDEELSQLISLIDEKEITFDNSIKTLTK